MRSCSFSYASVVALGVVSAREIARLSACVCSFQVISGLCAIACAAQVVGGSFRVMMLTFIEDAKHLQIIIEYWARFVDCSTRAYVVHVATLLTLAGTTTAIARDVVYLWVCCFACWFQVRPPVGVCVCVLSRVGYACPCWLLLVG